MKIEILSWECKGLRCPDMTIDLRINGSLAHIALIQMPNGTAKTTTLTLIRAALTGDAKSWTSDIVRSYRRVGKTNDEGSFILNLRVDDKPLTFELSFDFIEGSVTYYTSSPLIGGFSDSWNPPMNIRRFLDKKFVKLFIFDGELAQELLDGRKSEASQAIDSLFQLYLLEKLKDIANFHWERETANKAKTGKGFTQQKNKVNNLKERIEKVQKRQNSEIDKINRLEQEIKELESKINKFIGQNEDIKEELNDKERELESVKGSITMDLTNVMNIIRQPHLLHSSFLYALLELKDKFDKAELPEKASRQFFEDLCKDDNCICGRIIDDEIRQIIRQRASLYLSNDTAIFLNSLKEDIEKITSLDEETEASLSESIRTLQEDKEKREQIEIRCRFLEQKRIDQGNDEEKSWNEQRDAKKNEKGKAESILEGIERDIKNSDDPKSPHKTWCLKALKKWLEEQESKLAEITQTQELLAKKQIFLEIIKQVETQASENLRESLLNKCNKKLELILYRDPIRISKIGNCIKLQGQKSASVGQILSVGYVFLTTLLNRVQHQFPLVVDSPANSIDGTGRRQMGKLIPKLCKQFIAFTISTEREGFTDTLTQYADSTKFITVFRKTKGTEQLQETLPQQGVIETDNGFIIEGKDYFDSFDLEEYTKEV